MRKLHGEERNSELGYDLCYMERVAGIEPASSGWKPEVIAIIRHPRRADGSQSAPLFQYDTVGFTKSGYFFDSLADLIILRR